MKQKKVSLQTIVFDFDGTLAVLNIDFPVMRQRIMDLITHFIDAPSEGLEDLFALEMIEAGRKVIALNCPEKERPFVEEAYSLIRDIEMEGAKNGALFEGIEEMLLELKARNIKVGVVTRNCLEAVTYLYPHIELHCDTIITREATNKVKPHPEQLRIALDALAADPACSAMVGDHPMDISVGKEVGTYTVGVLTGYAPEELLREAGADVILKDATKITDIL